MRFLTTVKIGSAMLLAALLFCTTAMAQDLGQQKQDLIKQVRNIDKQLNDSPSADEYADLIKQREAIEAQLKEVQKKLMADADAMKKINSVKKAFNEALNAYKLGQYQQGIDHADRAIATDPAFFKAYYVKGLCLKKLRKSTDAVTSFKAALEQNPAYSEAAAELGKLYVAMGQESKAIVVYTESLQNNSGAYKVHYELGRVYLDKKKNYNKAAENFSKATQINPNYDLAYLSLGVSLTELNRLDEALLALDNAIDASKRKRWHTPHYRKAIIFNKKGSSTKAMGAADQALKLKKNYAPAAYEAGKAAKTLGQFTKAISYFKVAAKSRQWKRSADYEIDLIVNRDKYGSD